MSANTELGQFLRTRRARVDPTTVGLPTHTRRRVPGLRREELAQLAGVSVSYYTRIEQGQSGGASLAVLEAIARVLGLSEDEHAHLLRLAAGTPHRPRQPRPERLRPSMASLLSALPVPAAVVGRSMDILGWNGACHTLLFSHLPLDAPSNVNTRPNWARLMFTDDHVRGLFMDWETKRRDVVAYLRFQATQWPHDVRLSHIVGELSLDSDLFAKEWARHNVKDKRPSKVRLRHPLVGELELFNETFRSPESPDQMFATFHAQSGTTDEEALGLLSHLREASAPVAPPIAGRAVRHR